MALRVIMYCVVCSLALKHGVAKGALKMARASGKGAGSYKVVKAEKPKKVKKAKKPKAKKAKKVKAAKKPAAKKAKKPKKAAKKPAAKKAAKKAAKNPADMAHSPVRTVCHSSIPRASKWLQNGP